jgi:hypothetical protein
MHINRTALSLAQGFWIVFFYTYFALLFGRGFVMGPDAFYMYFYGCLGISIVPSWHAWDEE